MGPPGADSCRDQVVRLRWKTVVILERMLPECSSTRVATRSSVGSGRMEWRASGADMGAQAHCLTVFLLAEDCIE